MGPQNGDGMENYLELLIESHNICEELLKVGVNVSSLEDRVKVLNEKVKDISIQNLKERKDLASSRYALDNFKRTDSDLVKIKMAWEAGFDTALNIKKETDETN